MNGPAANFSAAVPMLYIRHSVLLYISINPSVLLLIKSLAAKLVVSCLPLHFPALSSPFRFQPRLVIKMWDSSSLLLILPFLIFPNFCSPLLFFKLNTDNLIMRSKLFPPYTISFRNLLKAPVFQLHPLIHSCAYCYRFKARSGQLRLQRKLSYQPSLTLRIKGQSQYECVAFPHPYADARKPHMNSDFVSKTP